jgi:hypothetical protein
MSADSKAGPGVEVEVRGRGRGRGISHRAEQSHEAIQRIATRLTNVISLVLAKQSTFMLVCRRGQASSKKPFFSGLKPQHAPRHHMSRRPAEISTTTHGN